MRKFCLIMYLFLLLFVAPINAQINVTTNSANVHDPRLMLVNPAGIGFNERGFFVAGSKLFYVSLGDERLGNFYSGICYRLFEPGNMGLTFQSFCSGTFHQTQFEVNYAIPFNKKKFALGGRIGVLNVAYNTKKFNLFHNYDPLLIGNPSKNVANYGLGVLVNPVAMLYLGLSADHLNRPQLALEYSKDRREVNINLSAIYRYPVFSPQVCLEREENESYLTFGLESWLLRNQAVLRGNYSTERLTFGAGYNFNICRIDYEYDYYLSDLQQVSNGSHQVTLSFAFGHPDTLEPDFKINITPLDSMICIKNGVCYGQQALYRINVLPIDGFSKQVKLSLENVPPDLSYQFSTPKIAPMETCTLRVIPQRQCLPKSYPLIVKGKSCCKKRRDASSVRVRLPRLIPKIYSNPTALTITEKYKIFEESPLLNYVFFDSSDSNILLGRYAILDSEKALQMNQQYFSRLDSITEQYRHVLNIFGWRLKNNPDFKILMVGCNDSCGTERNNLALSRNRAQNVKDYFVTVWGISPEQIEVTERNLPMYPSTLNDPRGLQENRRVEIQPQSGSEQILAADITTMLEVTLSDSPCVFDSDGSIVEAGVKNWQLAVMGNDGSLLHIVKGDTTLRQLEIWDWRDSAWNVPSFQDSLTFSLSITDKYGQERVASGLPIRIHHVRQDTIIERSRLLFFAFDSCRMDLQLTHLKAEIDSIVTKFKRHAFARVKVRGYTDVIGDTSINIPLSECRAQAVREELIRRGIPEGRISAEGFGPEFPIMTNDLPEGRMMNRRVEVDIIYPQ